MLFKNHVNISGQKLNTYHYSSGGGMNGGYYSETITRMDDTYALLSIEKANWYYQDPEVQEYLVDVFVLNDLENIVRKGKMNFWNRKKFTNMFVADGESYSYSFDFDKSDLSFSSQYYPEKYRKKLKKIDDIIKIYLTNSIKLPTLVNERVNSEEFVPMPEGKVEIYVYKYSRDYLSIRIQNGTDKVFEYTKTLKLIDVDNNIIILEQKDEYKKNILSKSLDEFSIHLEERLQAGNYKIILDDNEILFEIR